MLKNWAVSRVFGIISVRLSTCGIRVRGITKSMLKEKKLKLPLKAASPFRAKKGGSFGLGAWTSRVRKALASLLG